jgi:hypothetical protein
MDVLVEFGFKVHRGMETEGAVEPLAVVKDFDPLEDGGRKLLHPNIAKVSRRNRRPTTTSGVAGQKRLDGRALG